MGLFTFSDDYLKRNFLPKNDAAQDEQCPGLWNFVRRFDMLDALIGNDRGRCNQKGHNNECDQGLYFSMSLGMVLIRRFLSIFEAQQYQKGRKNIGSGFYRICDECIGVSKKSCRSLDQGQPHISKYAEVGGSYGRFLVGHGV